MVFVARTEHHLLRDVLGMCQLCEQPVDADLHVVDEPAGDGTMYCAPCCPICNTKRVEESTAA